MSRAATDLRLADVRAESWPLARPFAIARGTKTAADVVVVEITQDGCRGRGECVPYARYGESIAGVTQAVRDMAAAFAQGPTPDMLPALMPAGAARDAVEAALWDLRAKQQRRRVWELVGIPAPRPVVTAETIGIAAPAAMAEAAASVAGRPLLKVKLDREQIGERVKAVRSAAPRARLIVDANEAWDLRILMEVAPLLAEAGVELIEQPLPADADAALAGVRLPVPLCADEALHTRADLERVAERYQAVNIKLGKAGGLTTALALAAAARRCGLQIMVGCMVSTSLAIAPAFALANAADFVDLDGPLWLAGDRSDGLRFANGRVHPPSVALWG